MLAAIMHTVDFTGLVNLARSPFLGYIFHKLYRVPPKGSDYK